MQQTAENHIAIFLTMLYAGLIVGALYDVIRYVKRAVGAGKLVAAIADVFFWVGAAAAFFLFLLLASGGRLQIFAFVGCAAGCGLWLGLVSPVLNRIFKPDKKPPKE